MVSFAYYDERWKDHVPDTKGLSAEDQYQVLTQAVIELTSQHIISNFDGTLIPRAAREANFREAVRLVNRELKLGLDTVDMEVLTLVYTALSEVPRFGENEHMPAHLAGNTATHSIHTPLRANLLIRRGLERLGAEENRESVLARQLAGLCLMPHDLGESLGEPGSLAQESKHAASGFQKDKPEAERLVMNAVLRLAAHAVERGDTTVFYDRIDQMKIPNMKETAPAQSNEEFLTQVREKLGVPPEISLESEGRVALLSDFWEMQEHPGRVPNRFQGDDGLNANFVAQLAALSEHMQGEGHFLLFCQKEHDPSGETAPWFRVQSFRQMRNLKYNEGEIGNLFAAAQTPLEKAVAIEAKREAYEKSIEFLELGAAAVDRTAEAGKEVPALEADARDAEIAELVKKSEAEGTARRQRGEDDHGMRNVETRDRLIAMYRWAMENDDFIPAPGQILIYEPPTEFKAPELGQDNRFTDRVAASKGASGQGRSAA